MGNNADIGDDEIAVKSDIARAAPAARLRLLKRYA